MSHIAMHTTIAQRVNCPRMQVIARQRFHRFILTLRWRSANRLSTEGAAEITTDSAQPSSAREHAADVRDRYTFQCVN